MSTENKSKDWFDKIDILGRAMIPIVFFVLGLIVNNRLTAETRDVDVVQRFSNIYYYEGNQDSRRLSIYYIRLIDNEQTRYELRQFVIWDTLERNITYNFNFSFDPELSDWHMVGDTVLDMADDDSKTANLFWCNLKSTVLKRWPAQEIELSKLFDWVDSNYKKDAPDWGNCS